MNRSRLAALSAGAMFLVASVLLPATALAAGSGTVSLTPPTVTTATGSTFTVTINTQATVPMSGASAALDFDRTKLQIVSVTKGAGWNVAGTTWVAPSVADISQANATGHLKAIGVYFSDGTSSVPANTATSLATVSFFAYAGGSSNIAITATGPEAAQLIDGTAATYGTPVGVTIGTVVPVTASGTGSGNTTPATITGSVAAPSLALTCPTAVTVPLVRNVNNQAPFECVVASDGSWTISVKDNNPDANHGKLVDATGASPKVLTNSLRVVGALDVDLAASLNLAPVTSGTLSASAGLTFTQVVAPSDKAGSYGMSVLFSIVNTF